MSNRVRVLVQSSRLRPGYRRSCGSGMTGVARTYRWPCGAPNGHLNGRIVALPHVGESSYPVRGAWLGLLEGSCDV
jgi:hypothetical protein